jgi:hypothetical protein
LAAKRELLDKHGFYDVNIIGGGDNAVVCSIYKEFSGFVNKFWNIEFHLVGKNQNIIRNVITIT